MIDEDTQTVSSIGNQHRIRNPGQASRLSSHKASELEANNNWSGPWKMNKYVKHLNAHFVEGFRITKCICPLSCEVTGGDQSRCNGE
jgi:hypothetical protein